MDESSEKVVRRRQNQPEGKQGVSGSHLFPQFGQNHCLATSNGAPLPAPVRLHISHLLHIDWRLLLFGLRLAAAAVLVAASRVRREARRQQLLRRRCQHCRRAADATAAVLAAAAGAVVGALRTRLGGGADNQWVAAPHAAAARRRALVHRRCMVQVRPKAGAPHGIKHHIVPIATASLQNTSGTQADDTTGKEGKESIQRQSLSEATGTKPMMRPARTSASEQSTYLSKLHVAGP